MAFGSSSTRQNVALLIFNATTWAGVAVNEVSSPITTVAVSLHTADPNSGNQTTSEATYTGYSSTRPAPARTSGGYSCTAGVASNVAAVTFGACSAGSNTISHAGVGKSATSTGELFCSGALTANLAVSAGITPQFAIGALSVTIA